MALSDLILADAPLGYYRTSSGADSSGHGLDLTPFGSPGSGSSLDPSDSSNGAVTLTGSNNLWNPEHWVEFDLTGAVSLEALFKATTIGADQDLVRKNWLYGLYLGAAGKVHATVKTADGITDLAGATTISAGTTYHVGMTFDGVTVRLYVNGVLDASTAVPKSILIEHTQALTIGTSGIGGFAGLTGSIDEVAVYKTVLAPERFMAHHAASLGSAGVLWVDPSNGASSDAGNRAAAMNPATPLKTITRAAELALDGDAIKFLPSGSADTTNTFDTAVYAPIYSGVYGQPLLPLADGVTVIGVESGGTRPKWAGVHATGLMGWTVQGYQAGYDLGSTHEYNTNASLLGGGGFRCTDVIFTGGGYQLLGVNGAVFTGCTITAKLRPTPAGFLEGNGFRCGVYTDYTITAADRFEWHECTFDQLQGEDAVQLFIGGEGGVLTGGKAILEHCRFNRIEQTNEFHTDGIQSLGCSLLRVANCTFGDEAIVSSMIISSDGYIGRLELENNLFVGRPGSGYLTQFAGVYEAVVRHNTWLGSGFAGLRFYSNANLPPTYNITVHSNVIDNMQVNIPTSGTGVTWFQHDNVIGTGDYSVLDFHGYAEFGSSGDTDYELANAGGFSSLGIDQAYSTDINPVIFDRLGRPREGAAPDCGCHESSLSRPVTAGPRAPIVVGFSPANGATGVSTTTSVTVELFPKPGETIDAATVTSSSFYVHDSDGYNVPVVSRTVGAPDGAGHQLLTIDIDGTLYQRVTFGTFITAAIADTEGSTLSGGASSVWRTAGPAGPAVGEAPSGSSGWSIGSLA